MSETQTASLTDFLLARIAEDEAGANRNGPMWFTNAVAGAQPVPANDPARALAECGAKRRIVAQWRLELSDDGLPLGGLGAEVQYDTLRALASIYADHPDYRAEWAL